MASTVRARNNRPPAMGAVGFAAGSSHRDLLADELNDRIRLESDIVGERWRRLKLAIVRVQNHKDGYRQDCKMLAEEQLALAKDREVFEEEVKARWPAAALDDEAKQARYLLNVGGRRFETTAEILTRDRFSVLASLCGDFPPVAADLDGSYFFDRDGDMFQHVLNFLRSGALPEEEEALRGMFNEAAFFRLGLLRRHLQARFDTIVQGRQASMHRAAMANASASMASGNFAGALAMQRSQVKAAVRAQERDALRQSMQARQNTKQYEQLKGSKSAVPRASDSQMNSMLSGTRPGALSTQMQMSVPMPPQMPPMQMPPMQMPPMQMQPMQMQPMQMPMQMPMNMSTTGPSARGVFQTAGFNQEGLGPSTGYRKGTLPDPYRFASRSMYGY